MYPASSTYQGGATARPGRGGIGYGQLFTGLLAFSLVGCVGSVSDPSPEDPSLPPGTTGGTSTTPGVVGNVPPPAPTSCKVDQIGLSPLRRLTKQEYDNTVRELLGVDLDLAKDFNADELAGPFPGNYFTPISESSFTQYASAAASAATKTVEMLGQLVPCATSARAGTNEAGCANQFIKQFGRRAYRRPLDDGEVGRFETVFKAGRDGGDFSSGISLVVQAMLESPHFLYLVEGPGPLTQHQLAARMSYFLWNAPPDARLSTLADSAGLRTPEALRLEARRMLADPRAQAVIDDFHVRWLALEDDLDTLEKDETVHPDFKAAHPFMREELRRFSSYVMTQGDGKLETLLTAPFTMANGTLAKLYGAKATGDWQKVDLDPTQRAGILTQSAFLATHGHEGSAPIFRGVAVREQLLCAELPPPPPGADANLPPASPTKTTRQRTEQHRTNPECASCHSLMDVLGYGFESFDDIGKFRTTENGQKIDDTGELVGTDVDGAFKGPVELGKRLASSSQVQKCVTKQWFRYALGRIETDLDACTLEAVYQRFKKSEFNLPELLVALVESDSFRVRRAEEPSK